MFTISAVERLFQAGWFEIVVLAVANIPLYWLLAWAMFKNVDDFLDCLGYMIQPDYWSFTQGELLEDKFSSLKLIGWVLLCVACVYGEYQFYSEYIRPVFFPLNPA